MVMRMSLRCLGKAERLKTETDKTFPEIVWNLSLYPNMTSFVYI